MCASCGTRTTDYADEKLISLIFDWKIARRDAEFAEEYLRFLVLCEK